MIENLYNQIINNKLISQDDIPVLQNADLNTLVSLADKIREHFCSSIFDMCSIINAKSGRCSEDCKFCAQSVYYNTNISEYSLINTDEIVNNALYMAKKGVLRFSIVASGRSLTGSDIDNICSAVKKIKSQSGISICASLGLLSDENFKKIKDAGIERIHNNIETSKNFFSKICSTHTIEDKINTIKKAKEHGFSVCSGIIIGLGESMQDRIDAAFLLRDLGVSSIPLNILNSIKGTPFENNKKLSDDEILRTCAVFRFILPNVFLRLAGGRVLLSDYGEKAVHAGINAFITGSMLTTDGISCDYDINMVKKAGYTIRIV